MRRAVIFAGAPTDLAVLPEVPTADCYICADAGLRLAQVLHIQPDWIVGDFDSLGEMPVGVQVVAYPAEKDDTDTILAARYALSQDCEELVFYGVLGGRLDHTVANLQMLRWLADCGARGILVDENHWVTLQRGGTAQYAKRDGYFSLFSLSEYCTDVTLEGVAYPLEHAILSGTFPLGISNVIQDAYATVTVGDGDLLVIFAADV